MTKLTTKQLNELTEIWYLNELETSGKLYLPRDTYLFDILYKRIMEEVNGQKHEQMKKDVETSDLLEEEVRKHPAQNGVYKKGGWRRCHRNQKV